MEGLCTLTDWARPHIAWYTVDGDTFEGFTGRTSQRIRASSHVAWNRALGGCGCGFGPCRYAHAVAANARSMLGPRRGGQKCWSESDLKCDQPPPLLFPGHLAVRYSSR